VFKGNDDDNQGEAMSENKTIGEALREKGYKLTFHLVRDEFNGVDGNSYWQVSLTRNGQSYSTEYTQAVLGRHFRNGRPLKFCHINKHAGITIHQHKLNKQTKPNKPTYADVVYCLLSDAQSVCYGQSFEDYCSDFGDSIDSRRAHACYTACVECWQGLIRMGADFDGLNTLFEDF
jgi:hypothetical protein